jgi:MFS family permease
MWLARLLVQIAEASLFAFLLLWFRSVDAGVGANVAANIFTAVLGAAVAMTLVIGRWSDRHGQPTMPLVIAAAAAAVGLLVMSLSSAFASAIAGYVIFGLASSIFLALHASQTLRVLASARRRGRDLGVFNLTNTVPSLIMPWLTLALVPVYGFDALFLMLAALAFAACLLLVTMPPPPARNL